MVTLTVQHSAGQPCYLPHPRGGGGRRVQGWWQGIASHCMRRSLLSTKLSRELKVIDVEYFSYVANVQLFKYFMCVIISVCVFDPRRRLFSCKSLVLVH
jgi:hypothetical protein